MLKVNIKQAIFILLFVQIKLSIAEEKSVLCPENLDPVCCTINGTEASERNEHCCQNKGGNVKSKGTCACQEVYKPVCCKLDGGESTEYNRCECDSDFGVVRKEEPCNGPCPAVYKPVCCSHSNTRTSKTIATIAKEWQEKFITNVNEVWLAFQEMNL